VKLYLYIPSWFTQGQFGLELLLFIANKEVFYLFIYLPFLNHSSEYIKSSEIVTEYWREYERSGRGLFEVLSRYFFGSTLEIHEYHQYG